MLGLKEIYNQAQHIPHMTECIDKTVNIQRIFDPTGKNSIVRIIDTIPACVIKLGHGFEFEIATVRVKTIHSCIFAGYEFLNGVYDVRLWREQGDGVFEIWIEKTDIKIEGVKELYTELKYTTATEAGIRALRAISTVTRYC